MTVQTITTLQSHGDLNTLLVPTLSTVELIRKEKYPDGEANTEEGQGKQYGSRQSDAMSTFYSNRLPSAVTQRIAVCTKAEGRSTHPDP